MYIYIYIKISFVKYVGSKWMKYFLVYIIRQVDESKLFLCRKIVNKILRTVTKNSVQCRIR